MTAIMQVSGILVNCEAYYFANGKLPRGGANWAFTFGNGNSRKEQEPHFYDGSFAQARNQAIRDAKKAGVYTIKVAL